MPPAVVSCHPDTESLNVRATVVSSTTEVTQCSSLRDFGLNYREGDWGWIHNFQTPSQGLYFFLCVSNAPREGKKGDPYNVLTSAIILGSYFQEICLDEVLNVQLQTEKVSSRHFLLQMKRVTFKLHGLGVKPRGIFKTWQRSLKRRIFTGSLMDIDKIFKDLQTFFSST